MLALAGEVSASAEVNRNRMRVVRVLSRIVVLLIVVATVVLLGIALTSAVQDGPEHDVEWLSLLESAVNDVVFAAIAIWFLYTVPERLRRAEG